MKVSDIWINRKGITYGYCGCGREVNKNTDTKCPCCGAPLEWGNCPQASKGR